MLGAEGMSVSELTEALNRIERLSQGPFGVNFLMPFLDDPVCVELAASRARVVDFFYGSPDARLIEMVHRSGALASWQVGSRAEALAAAAAGSDFIIIQGV